ncbi:MAG: (d)CMP kinase [Clostridia bacterium]|nr:(d)CMP kinase [Clostridia bacterium]
MIAIAIDGPAGAGKSTIARAVAKELGYIYVDTGALYRTVGLKFSREGVDTSLKCDIEKILKETNVDIAFVGDEQHVFLNGEDVSDKIRTPEASMMASAVSAVPVVRAFLLDLQRKMARENNVIMDGRDIGTVILPNAQVKIFLTASPEERARRRFVELTEKGTVTTFEEVLSDMKVRDYNDSHREIAPLKPAEDSKVVDTTGLTLEESKAAILDVVKNKVGA